MEFVRLLEEIGFEYQDDPKFTERELEEEIAEWAGDTRTDTLFFSIGVLGQRSDFKRLARFIGPADFSRLVVKKGLEGKSLYREESLDQEDWKFTTNLILLPRTLSDFGFSASQHLISRS